MIVVTEGSYVRYYRQSTAGLPLLQHPLFNELGMASYHFDAFVYASSYRLRISTSLSCILIILSEYYHRGQFILNRFLRLHPSVVFLPTLPHSVRIGELPDRSCNSGAPLNLDSLIGLEPHIISVM